MALRLARGRSPVGRFLPDRLRSFPHRVRARPRMDRAARRAEVRSMFSTIVVGCDGSPGSLAAIELAERLRDPGGRLVLVSVRPSEVGFGTADFNRRAEETAQGILRLSARRVGEGVTVETVSEAHNSVAGGINDVAERQGADLIVLGPTHH